jgi:hypothetical protein
MYRINTNRLAILTFTGRFRVNKIKILFLLYFLFSIGKIYSQNTDLPFKAAITAGASFPIGNFSKTAPDSGKAHGAAEPGPLITASFSYRFRHSQFGVEIMGGWQQNDINNLAIARDMASQSSQVIATSVKDDNWHIWKVLAGPTFELSCPKNKKLSFEADILGGIMKTTVPGGEMGVSIANPPTVFVVGYAPTPLSATFCYQIDAGINYHIRGDFLLTGNLGFTHASPVHTFFEYTDPPYFTLPPVQIKQTYPISTINLLLGVAYIF